MEYKIIDVISAQVVAINAHSYYYVVIKRTCVDVWCGYCYTCKVICQLIFIYMYMVRDEGVEITFIGCPSS